MNKLLIALSMILSISAFADDGNYTTGADELQRSLDEPQGFENHPDFVDSTTMPFDQYLKEVGKGMRKMLPKEKETKEEVEKAVFVTSVDEMI